MKNFILISKKQVKEAFAKNNFFLFSIFLTTTRKDKEYIMPASNQETKMQKDHQYLKKHHQADYQFPAIPYNHSRHLQIRSPTI